MKKQTLFEKQLANGVSIQVNGRPMQLAIYNLIISKRDLGLWRAGMKPTRNWKVTDVKKYFGLTGHDRQKLYQDICEMVKKHTK